jgi:hypothetical protein
MSIFDFETTEEASQLQNLFTNINTIEGKQECQCLMVMGVKCGAAIGGNSN